MKKMRYSLTIWFSLLIPAVAWFSIWMNNGIMPMFLQWNGPLLITVGLIMLRLRTSDAIVSHIDRKRKTIEQPSHNVCDDDDVCGTNSLS